MSGGGPLLAVERLSIDIEGPRPASVVEDVSFEVGAAETVALVGESGCGKSITALSILGLLEAPVRVRSGAIRFEGADLRQLSSRALRAVRGRRVSMIFQEPMTALNPVLTIGDQLIEGPRLHLGLSRSAARERATSLLAEVGIPSPRDRLDAYPHQLSGGMRQRVMIAMALACDPALLIADEPTTALDVTIQAQILELLERLRRDRGMSLLLITHDLGVVAEVAQRVVVMYAGRVVETAAVPGLFEHPQHPYTRGLLASVPAIDAPRGRLHSIAGTVPSPESFPPGCRFHPRCGEVLDRCRVDVPPLLASAGDARVACFARHPNDRAIGEASS